MIETLSGEKITETIIKTAKMPLPTDNWYSISDANESNRHWGTAPSSLFALIDDGCGSRWLPVEED